MRTEKEIREWLEKLKEEMLTRGPYTELENIALYATRQTLEWVLEEAETPLSY